MEENLKAYMAHRDQYIEQCSKRLFMEKVINKIASNISLEVEENELTEDTVKEQFAQSSERFIQSVKILKSLSVDYEKGDKISLV